MDRRALFFFGAALLCLALVPLTPDTYRYVGVVMLIWLTVLGLLSHLDYRSRLR